LPFWTSSSYHPLQKQETHRPKRWRSNKFLLVVIIYEYNRDYNTEVIIMPEIIILKTDITACDAEALVNPANSLMKMGGGVAGAIKRAAGAVVEEEAVKYAPVPVGGAIATSAGRLKSKCNYIIHAPTMEKPAMKTTKNKVYLATFAALKLAESLKIESIAFPAMGAGVGGLTVEESAEAMLSAIHQFLSMGKTSLKKIFLVGLSDEAINAFNKAARSMPGSFL
jgi:O-acetyl-ADP-ribose deacetylase (regulator of RNase III)